jgi:glutamate/tyrosine decarboxylase-like PLP-dependent enzyme
VDAVEDLFRRTAAHAAQFHRTLGDRPVRAEASFEEVREAIARPLPDEGADDAAVVAELVAGAEPGLVGTQTGRFYGFVIGSALPASVAADWLAAAWDQNGFNVTLSPAAAAFEAVAADWLAELLLLPPGVSSGFVTGAQGANTTALAAAASPARRACACSPAPSGT